MKMNNLNDKADDIVGNAQFIIGGVQIAPEDFSSSVREHISSSFGADCILNANWVIDLALGEEDYETINW